MDNQAEVATPVTETPVVEVTPTKQDTKPVEEVKSTETPKPEVKEEAPKVDPKVAELEAEIAKLREQLDASNKKDSQLTEVQKQVEELNKAIKDAQVYKDTVANTLKAKLETIPEDKRSVVPNLSDVEKLSWIENAEKIGLFTPPTVDPNLEIGKPFNPKTDSKVDINNMTPRQMLLMGLNNK